MKKVLFAGLVVSALSFPALAAVENREVLFGAMDHNKDGVVTRLEYINFQERQFVEGDKNRDWALSRQEMEIMEEQRKEALAARR